MKKIAKLLKLFESEKLEDAPPPKIYPNTIILLGTGGSGKSSILKRCTPHQEETYYKLSDVVCHLLFHLCGDFIKNIGDELKVENSLIFKDKFSHFGGSDFLKASSHWCEELARDCYTVYWDSRYQHEIHLQHASFPYPQSIQYFMRRKIFKNLLRVSSEIQLNRDDFFFAAIKTTGIIKRKYRDGYTIVDTGGQRTERKKWIGISNEVVDIPTYGYVISLSEFDELCYEDNVTNRYQEAKSAFQEFYHCESMPKLPINLIFNKYDVLEQKVRDGIKFSQHVPQFEGDDNDVESISEFIVRKYLEIDSDKRVVKHFKISAFHSDQLFKTLNEIFGIVESPTPSTNPTKVKYYYTNKHYGEFPFKSLVIDEIIFNILEFINLDELIGTHLFISKYWQDIALKVPISIFRPNLENFIHSRFENVKMLNLQSTCLQRRHIEILAHNPKFKHVQFLNVSNNYLVTTQDWEYLFEHNKFKNLQVIVMEYCNLSSFNFLLKIQNLKRASLYGNIANIYSKECETILQTRTFEIDNTIIDPQLCNCFSTLENTNP